jgi:GNAT superfamily N-acetyltransferase
MDDDYAARVRDGRAVVAELDGRIAGLLVLVPHDDHLLVENVAVEPAHQGEGIGRALMAYAEERAAELGLGELRLYTHVKMTENRALYARLGYSEVDRRVDSGFERVFMSKKLGE